MSPLGNPARIYRMFLNREIVLVYSAEIMLEYEDVLHRSRLHIDKEDADMILEAIRQFGELVAPQPSAEPMNDEDDRPFYDAAKSADAFLVTGNMRHYPAASFVLTPKDFLGLCGLLLIDETTRKRYN
jgi:predicted nucleic acid-binding protein